MEFIEYSIIASSFAFLLWIVCLVTAIICCITGKWNDLVDLIAFNVFPGILKSKKNDRNETVVYLRQGKILLQEKTLSEAKKALSRVSLLFITSVIIGFGHFLFLEISYGCKNDQSHDCFEYPIRDGFHAVRANCSDPDILQGKTLVICYTLVFHFELAVGISYGMYRVCEVLLSLTSFLFLKMNQNQLRCFRISVLIGTIIIYIITLVLSIVYKSHPVFRINIIKLKMFINVSLGFLTVNWYTIFMPWGKIIEQERSRENTKEVGLDNITPTSSD